MIYVTSDLHGLEITKLKALLKKACFNENDRLSTAKMTAALQF